MFTFHEGLPRSGKSYECVVKQIIPALMKGRTVYAYIEGLNHELIASLADITTEQCKELLIQVEESQVTKIYDIVKNDSLVIIDELQDFFPSGRQKLSPEMTKFVTQHGHDGLDIIGMGQSLLDCHNIWRRRCQRKIIFTKLDMLGMENRYSWEMYTGKATNKDIKFVKINSGTEKYEERYFGTYKSHTDDTLNTGNLKDDRSNIFKTSGFRFGLPAALVVGFFAIQHLIGFFSPPEKIIDEPVNRESLAKLSAPAVSPQVSAATPLPIKRTIVGTDQTLDYVEKMALNYRLSLVGFIENTTRFVGLVEALDSSNNVKDRITLKEIEALGWKLKPAVYGVVATKDETTLLFRNIPTDLYGRINNKTAETL